MPWRPGTRRAAGPARAGHLVRALRQQAMTSPGFQLECLRPAGASQGAVRCRNAAQRLTCFTLGAYLDPSGLPGRGPGVPLGNSADHAGRLWLTALSRLVNRRRWPEIFPVTPATILRWHRDLAARKRACTGRRRPGRPPAGNPVKTLIVAMARENPAGGIGESRLSWRGPGMRSPRPRCGILDAAGTGPAPRRAGPAWRQVLAARLARSSPVTSGWRERCCPAVPPVIRSCSRTARAIPQRHVPRPGLRPRCGRAVPIAPPAARLRRAPRTPGPAPTPRPRPAGTTGPACCRSFPCSPRTRTGRAPGPRSGWWHTPRSRGRAAISAHRPCRPGWSTSRG